MLIDMELKIHTNINVTTNKDGNVCSATENVFFDADRAGVYATDRISAYPMITDDSIYMRWIKKKFQTTNYRPMSPPALEKN